MKTQFLTSLVFSGCLAVSSFGAVADKGNSRGKSNCKDLASHAEL
ncbi:MAG: hypothetical protein ACI9BW_002263 [Gammaproteobacteria bacterium]|jgi:hypothetical protein